MAERGKVLARAGALVGLILFFSFLSARIWGEKPEKIPPPPRLVLEEGMTVAEFGQRNGLPEAVLKKVFELETARDLQKKLGEFNLAGPAVADRVEKALALGAEYESKNWVKIPLKFALWFAFLLLAFALLRRGRVRAPTRKKLYLAAAALFGVILGSDPSPMGTVKDAIVLLGAKGVIFPPRMIAFSVFLALVLLANKFICSWGCQAGVLQDLIFRLNRSPDDRKGLFRQYKLPFAVTNGIRAAFFVAVTAAAFLWAADLVEPIDPFKVYKPAMLGVLGGAFLGGVLGASLLVYRPWCHLFCPFGLVGWLVEKISLFKIQVNYQTCIACEACARACPSTVMGAILKQDRVIPDCFACGTCIPVCPTKSVLFSASKRTRPPVDKFKKKAG